MEVSSETKRKVREFVFEAFGKDMIRDVDLRIGINDLGEDSFFLSLAIEPDIEIGAAFDEKGDEIFHLATNILRIGGKELDGLLPMYDVYIAKD